MIETVAEHCKHENCRYRRRLSFVDDACFYLYYTGNLRRCPISQCDKYKPGKIRTVMNIDKVRFYDDDL